MEMNQNQIMELLDALYEKSINGIPKVSQPIDILANDYLSKNNSTEKAARQFVNYQVAKRTRPSLPRRCPPGRGESPAPKRSP